MIAIIKVDAADKTKVLVDNQQTTLNELQNALDFVTMQAQERANWRDELSAQIDAAKNLGAITIEQDAANKLAAE